MLWTQSFAGLLLCAPSISSESQEMFAVFERFLFFFLIVDGQEVHLFQKPVF